VTTHYVFAIQGCLMDQGAAKLLCWHVIAYMYCTRRQGRQNNSIINTLDKSSPACSSCSFDYTGDREKKFRLMFVCLRGICIAVLDLWKPWLSCKENHSDCNQSFESKKERNIRTYNFFLDNNWCILKGNHTNQST